MRDLDLSTIYCLGEAFEPKAFRTELVNKHMGSSVTAFHLGEQVPDEPLKLRWAQGSRLVDISGTTSVFPLVISNRFVEFLEEHHVSGWTHFPIEIRDGMGVDVTGFFGLAVRGRCGPLQPERSQAVTRTTMSGDSMTQAWIGYFVDEPSWDGSDVFVPVGTRLVFVVQRVADLLRGAGLTNLSLEPITRIERLIY